MSMAPSDTKPLAGKLALVTGGTSGLGLRVFQQLAENGAKVYVTGRNEEVGRKVVSDVPNAAFVRLDMSSIQSTHQGVAEFLDLVQSHENRLDIVVCNAGLLSKSFEISSDGIVDTMSTTYLGHFTLIHDLLPLLKQTASSPDADVRIVTVGSNAYKWPRKQRFDSLEHLNDRQGGDTYNAQMKRYGMKKSSSVGTGMAEESFLAAVSKLAQILWMRELQARLNAENANISCITANPGAIYSEGARSRIQKEFSAPLAKIGDKFLQLASSPPEKAAFSVVWAASAPDVKAEPQKYRDAYVTRKGKGVTVDKWAGRAVDEKARKDLWALSEKLVAEKSATSAGAASAEAAEGQHEGQ